MNHSLSFINVTSTKSVQRVVSLCKVKKVEHNVKRNTLTFFYIYKKKVYKNGKSKNLMKN